MNVKSFDALLQEIVAERRAQALCDFQLFERLGRDLASGVVVPPDSLHRLDEALALAHGSLAQALQECSQCKHAPVADLAERLAIAQAVHVLPLDPASTPPELPEGLLAEVQRPDPIHGLTTLTIRLDWRVAEVLRLDAHEVTRIMQAAHKARQRGEKPPLIASSLARQLYALCARRAFRLAILEECSWEEGEACGEPIPPDTRDRLTAQLERAREHLIIDCQVSPQEAYQLCLDEFRSRLCSLQDHPGPERQMQLVRAYLTRRIAQARQGWALAHRHMRGADPQRFQLETFAKGRGSK